VVASLRAAVLVPVASRPVPRIHAWPEVARPPAQRHLIASASRRGPPLLTF